MLKQAKAYCSKCKNATADDIRIVWNPLKLGVELLIDGITVSHKMLVNGIAKLQEEIFVDLQRLLFNVSLGKYLRNLEEVMRNGAIVNQFSYDSLLDTPDIKKIQAVFIEDITNDALFKREFANEKRTLEQSSMTKYLTRSGKLSQKLLCAMHLTCGFPGRATEIQTLKIRGSHKFANNIWLLYGRIVTITYYNKTSSILSEHRPIVRVLPHHLSKLLLIYLVCVRTVER
jgi:hypothetical protein